MRSGVEITGVAVTRMAAHGFYIEFGRGSVETVGTERTFGLTRDLRVEEC